MQSKHHWHTHCGDYSTKRGMQHGKDERAIADQGSFPCLHRSVDVARVGGIAGCRLDRRRVYHCLPRCSVRRPPWWPHPWRGSSRKLCLHWRGIDHGHPRHLRPSPTDCGGQNAPPACLDLGSADRRKLCLCRWGQWPVDRGYLHPHQPHPNWFLRHASARLGGCCDRELCLRRPLGRSAHSRRLRPGQSCGSRVVRRVGTCPRCNCCRGIRLCGCRWGWSEDTGCFLTFNPHGSGLLHDTGPCLRSGCQGRLRLRRR